MARFPLLAALCLGSAFLGALLALEISSKDPPEAAGPPPPTANASVDLGEVLARIDRIESALERGPLPSASTGPGEGLSAAEISDRLAEIEKRLEIAARPSSDPKSLAPLDADAPPEQVLIRARELGNRLKRWDESRDLLRELLAAGLSRKTRMDALWQLGVAERTLEDYSAANDAFFELLRLAGNDSERGMQALFQLAWTQSIAGDQGKATAYMEDVLRSPATTTTTAASARLGIAKFAILRGDRERARAELERILEEHGGDQVTPGLQSAVDEAKLLLGREAK